MTYLLRHSHTLLMAILLCSFFGSSNASASSWWETLKIKGDFRYRHEMIDKETSDVRNRQRMRARLGVIGKVSDHTTVGIQLASGSSDPISSNQTLDGAFSTKGFGLDLAYFESTIKGVKGLKLLGGKMKNPFHKPGKSELVWDGDLNPEGGTAIIKTSAESFTLKVVGSGFWIDERSSSDDTYLIAGQAVGKLLFNNQKSSVVFGGGLYNYENTQDFALIYDDEDPMGNSTVSAVVGTDTVQQYANDYDIVELFAEINHNFQNTPVTLIGHFVTNSGADSLNTGWAVGLRAGKTKNTGSMAFRYMYKKVEADAVLGAFTDSDFRGGGTDAKGQEVGGSVQMARNTTFSVTYFNNQLGLEAVNSTDFSRLQVDLQLKL